VLLQEGEIVIILDAGGGTVDAITYKVDQKYPLRLKCLEEVPSGSKSTYLYFPRRMLTEQGKLCGSSFLNDEFRKHIRARLTPVWKQLSQALKAGNSTFECEIESAVNVFEHSIKRTFGTSATMLDERVKIYGLNSDAKRRFDCNSIILSKYDCSF
jgi:hypothetical protein